MITAEPDDRKKAVSDLYGQQEDIAKKYTALTFDDGPNPKYTKPLLDGLRNVESA